MATTQKFLDKDGVIELTRGILSTVNDRIDERIVTTISSYSDDRHVASAAAVYRAIANSRHMTGEVIVGDIDELVPLAKRRTDIIYFQKDDENDKTWAMYVWYIPEDATEQPSWIYLGNTEINLDNYWSKSEEDIAEMKSTLGINTMQSTLNGKLDKDALKAISSEELQAILDDATYDTEVFVTTHTLTINWLEPNGVTPLFEPYVAEVREGGSYKVRSPRSDTYYATTYVTGTMGSEDKVINITYDVIEDLDEEDDFEWNLDITYVVPDGITAPAAVHQSIKAGTYYSITSPAVEGYTPDIAVVSGVMEDGRTVTVTYVANTTDSGAGSGTSSGDGEEIEDPGEEIDDGPVTATLTINYVGPNGDLDFVAPAQYTAQVEVGKTYNVPNPTVTGYHVYNNVAAVTGTMPAGGATVEVRYLEEDLDDDL